MANVTFIHPDSESLGVEYLMALLLREGHETNLIIYQAEDISVGKRAKKINVEKITEEVLKTQPHILAFSCMTDKYQFQITLCKVLKNRMPNAITIFGGIHPTAVPERVLSNVEVDCVAIGEAEKSFLEFLSKCSFDNKVILPTEPVKGIIFKKEGNVVGKLEEGVLMDLNTLPLPYKDPFYQSLSDFSQPYWIMASRGCPYSCSYCFNSYFRNLRGKSLIRQRTVDNVIQELAWAKNRFSPTYIAFLDDCFVYKKQWVLEFCERYRNEINLPFACTSIPQYVDKERSTALRDAGCFSIQIGVQSTDKEICRDILHRKFGNDSVAESMRILREAGILIQVDHMIGVPGDTLKSQEESLMFYNRNRPDRISVFWLTYYPQTPIVEIARQKGILTESDIASINEGERKNSGSVYSGGSMKNPKYFYGIALLMNYLPLLPKWLISFMVRTSLYKVLSIKNYYWSAFIPRALIGYINKNDLIFRSKFKRFIRKRIRNTS
jgi:anaerobic magnesium-protoporphyrin IX monomethyl ester cyclase